MTDDLAPREVTDALFRIACAVLNAGLRRLPDDPELEDAAGAARAAVDRVQERLARKDGDRPAWIWAADTLASGLAPLARLGFDPEWLHTLACIASLPKRRKRRALSRVKVDAVRRLANALVIERMIGLMECTQAGRPGDGVAVFRSLRTLERSPFDPQGLLREIAAQIRLLPEARAAFAELCRSRCIDLA